MALMCSVNCGLGAQRCITTGQKLSAPGMCNVRVVFMYPVTCMGYVLPICEHTTISRGNVYCI